VIGDVHHQKQRGQAHTGFHDQFVGSPPSILYTDEGTYQKNGSYSVDGGVNGRQKGQIISFDLDPEQKSDGQRD
jgi:hypothetical protein